MISVMKKAIAIFICVLTVFSLCACSAVEKNKLPGTTWSLSNVPEDTGMEGTLSFAKEGKGFTMTIDGRTGTGTYKLDSGEVVLTIDGESIAGPMVGNEITVTLEDGTQLSFIKD